MTEPSIPLRRWFPVVFVHSVLLHGLTGAIRPALAYALIAAEAPAWMLGVMAAVFATPALLLALPAGRMVDLRGERRGALVGSVLVCAGAAVAVFGYQSTSLILAACLLVGAGHLPSMLVGQSQVAHLTPSIRTDSTFGYYSLAASLGQLLGPFLLVLPGGQPSMPPLGSVFLACVGVALGLLVTSALFALRPLTSQPNKSGGVMRDAAGLLKTRGVLLALVVGAVPVAVLDLFQVYWPALGAERGMDVVFVSAVLSLRALFSMVSRIFVGRLVRWRGRVPVLATAILISGISLGLLVAPVSPEIIVLASIVFGLALGVCQPLGMSLLVSLTPSHNRGVSVSLRLAVNRAGQILTPLALGGLAGAVGSAGVILASAVLLAGSSAAAVRLPRESRGGDETAR